MAISRTRDPVPHVRVRQAPESGWAVGTVREGFPETSLGCRCVPALAQIVGAQPAERTYEEGHPVCVCITTSAARGAHRTMEGDSVAKRSHRSRRLVAVSAESSSTSGVIGRQFLPGKGASRRQGYRRSGHGRLEQRQAALKLKLLILTGSDSAAFFRSSGTIY